MKKILVIIFFIVPIYIWAQNDTLLSFDNPSMRGKIISNEKNFSSSFVINTRFYMLDTITIDSVKYNLPACFSVTNATNITGTQRLPMDSVNFDVTVYNSCSSNLPFYPVDLSISVYYSTTRTHGNNIVLASKIYYTPYTTIEIWDLAEFSSLPRRWLSPLDNPNAQRKDVQQSLIPQSDIIDWALYDFTDENWNDWRVNNYREVEVDGLAYNVLMKPIPNDSIAYYDALGEDSTQMRTNFTGIVTGRITAQKSDPNAQIGLAGLQVQLMEKDMFLGKAIYQHFETTYTDENGYYTIQYDENQASEGGYVELCLKVFAKDNGTYKVIGNTLLVSSKTEIRDIGSFGTNAGIITYDLNFDLDEEWDAFRCVHWVRKGCKYFEDESDNFYSGIRVKANCNIDGCFSNNYVYAQKPILHIGNGYGKKEHNTRHEFGHTAMYFLQSKNIKIPYGVSGVNIHGWNRENTSVLAWMEGWAVFVAAVLDAVYYQEDNEYGGQSGNMMNYENNEIQNSIANGFCSEYNIATALYDLWDGPHKVPQTGIPNTSYHGWNDNNSLTDSYNKWETTDSVELTLSQICAPLKKVTNSNKLKNLHCVQQYIDSLVSQMNTCQKKRDVIRVFKENRVVWNIADYNENVRKNIGNESSDGLFTGMTKNETGYFFNFLGISNWDHSVISKSWTDYYHISSFNENATNDWLYFVTDNNMHYIIDDYLIGYQSSADSKYTNAYLFNLYQGQTGYFSTCGDDNIINVRYGKLILGYTDGQKADFSIEDGSILMLSEYGSELTINDGSVLRIKSGGTLMADKNTRINIYGSGRIEVYDDAYICIDKDATIVLDDYNSIINVAADARVGINPIHSTNSGSCSCYNLCNMPYTGDGSIICPCGFGIFDYYDDYVVSESDTITGTKKFRQNVIIPSGVTLTLSNATFEMKENKSIIINVGGKLVVDNSTITNSSYCPDKMWNGIYVVGNSYQQQLAANQGSLEIKNNSLIENAEWGIITWNGYDYGTSGGIVKCSNSTFHNNGRAVEIYPYTNHDANNNECGNVSYLKNCNFTIDDNNIFASSNATYTYMIKMSAVNGISIRGCHFSDIRTGSPTRGIAIYLAGAGVNIKPSCSFGDYTINMPCICMGESRNTFSGFTKGISVLNTGSNYTINVFKTDFENCRQSVYSYAVNNYHVTLSDFNMNCSGIFSDPYGIYSEYSTGYKIEGNDFYTTYTANPNEYGSIGVLMDNSGTDANSIYRNTFDKLTIGVGSTTNNNSLQVLCNEFSNSFLADVVVNPSISPTQGSSSESAGNKFSSGCYNFVSSSSNITYYHNGANNSSNEYCPYNSINVTKVPNITANECESTICIVPIFPPINPPINPKSSPASDDITLYESLQQEYDSRLAEYDAAGYGFLLENFDEEDADIVALARLKQDTLITIHRAMAEIANRNIDAILQDTLVFDREALNGWYNRINTQTAKYSLVNSYFEVGEYALARQELASIPQRFALTTDELAEYDNFCQYQSLRESVYASGRNYAQFTETEIAELQTIAERNTGVSSAYANSVLCFFYDICRDEELDLDFDIDAPMNSKSTTAVAESDAEQLAIYVYPNPADEELNILLNSLPEGRTTIEFHDVTGRLVLSEEIKGNSTSINISSLRQGVYMYRIVNGDNVIARDRIVKE